MESVEIIVIGAQGTGKSSLVDRLTGVTVPTHREHGVRYRYLLSDDGSPLIIPSLEADATHYTPVDIVCSCSHAVLQASLSRRSTIYLVTFNIFDVLQSPNLFTEQLGDMLKLLTGCKGMVLLVGTHSDKLNYPEYTQLSVGRIAVPDSHDPRWPHWMVQLKMMDALLIGAMDGVTDRVVWNGTHPYFHVDCRSQGTIGRHLYPIRELLIFISSTAEILS